MYKKNNDMVATLGWIGSFLILSGYVLLINDVILANSLEYIGLNFLGSLGLAINLYYQKAQGALFLQICFIAVSLYGFWKILV